LIETRFCLADGYSSSEKMTMRFWTRIGPDPTKMYAAALCAKEDPDAKNEAPKEGMALVRAIEMA
jgi:hypothetical protein